MAGDFSKFFDLLKTQPTLENVISVLYILNERLCAVEEDLSSRIEKLESKIFNNGFVKEEDMEIWLNAKANSSDISVIRKDIEFINKNIENLQNSIVTIQRSIDGLRGELDSIVNTYRLYNVEELAEEVDKIDTRLRNVEARTIETKANTGWVKEQVGLIFSLIVLALGTIINIILTLLKK